MAAHPVALACEHTCRDLSFEDRFIRFVDALQALAGEIAQGSRSLHEIARSIAARLPAIHSATEFLLLRSVLVEFSARTLATAAPHRLPSILGLTTLRPAPAACPCCRLGDALVRCLSTADTSTARTVPASIQTVRSVRAMAVIQSRCCEPTVTAASVASSVGVSREYLAKLLHVHQGCGFRAALRAARLKRASQLLEQSLVSMKEIAARSGYSSTSQFDRDFRRQYAVTPGEYRRRCCAGTTLSSHVESAAERCVASSGPRRR